MPGNDPIRERLAPVLYGLLVFSGTLVLGWVILPVVGTASGAFASEADSAAFFSLATLKGIPYLVGGSVLSVLVHPWLAGRRLIGRAAITLLDIIVCWVIAAGIAIARLG